MLQRLRAEECMTAATQAAVGRGFRMGHWIKRQHSLWESQAAAGIPTRKATPSDLASMGIGVRVVPPRKAKANG